jgi:hypothetical protein
MNGDKIALLLITWIAIGVIALPQAVSLFAGQHYWYNLSGTTSDIPCEKCHADIVEEMGAHVGPHTGETGYGSMECGYCHRAYFNSSETGTYFNYTYALISGSYTAYTPGKEAHAATTVPCKICHKGNATRKNTGEFDPTPHDFTTRYEIGEMDCLGCHASPGLTPSARWDEHIPRYTNEDCYKCHVHYADINNNNNSVAIRIPPAGGFGFTAHPDDTGSMAAHMAFINESRAESTLTDENEACIACHTSVAVKIDWIHARSLEFNVGIGSPMTTAYGPHNWTLIQWNVNGTAYTTVWGNTTGYGSTTYTENWPGSVDDVYQ